MTRLKSEHSRFYLHFILMTIVWLRMVLYVGAETVLDEGFENYSIGSIGGQNAWIVSSGSCTITSDSSFVRTGAKAARFAATNQTMQISKTSYSGSEPGVGGIVYVDLWIRINSMADKDFAVNGYDLFGGSEKRAFVLEFDTPSGGCGDFRIYDNYTKTVIGQYNLTEWNRISAQIDFEHAVYSVIYNNGSAVTVNFREDYTPTASGTRLAGIKEYHELRFNLGSEDASGSVDAVLDDIYIGTDAIPDVTFPLVSINYTINIEQPVIGTITLDPDLSEYPEGSEVTASLALPDGYQNEGWTGDLSGTELVKTFTVGGNMTIGADIGVDPDNPPPLYVITLIQPEFGYILLEPTGGDYYKFMKVTVKIDVQPGYVFNGWTGDLSGTDPEQTLVVESDLTIGATVVQDTTPPTIYTINNADDLKNTCKGTNLKAGDIVEVLDGYYDAGGISIEASGTSSQPIIIRSKNIGGAILNGDTYFDLRRAAYIQIEGFDVRSGVYTVIKLQACNNIRITRNIFHLTETDGQNGKWILIGGIWNDSSAPSHHNRIDHNIFKEKHQLGNFITIDGQQEPYYQMSQYDRIDHNYFYNIGPRAVNEMEAIRVGVSDLSMSSAYCIIESNLFEECNGDPEIISVKSCDNIIRHNTFRRCEGTLCLRHGNRNEVYGNFFFGEGKTGTGGIRIYGNDHKIYNNYFDGLTGTKWDAPITLTNGDYDGENSGGLADHWRVKRAIICHNTLLNNDYNIEIGFTNNGNYSKSVKDVIFSNNIVYGKQNNLIRIITPPENMQWCSNLMYPDSLANLGIAVTEDEITVADPMLIPSENLWRLGSSSPAVDAVTDYFDFLIVDIDGQPRDNLADIGADELSSAPVSIYPLRPENVGPFAVDSVLSGWNYRTIPRNYQLLKSYPNPFNSSVTIEYGIEHAGLANLTVYNILGQKIAVLVNDNLKPGKYLLKWDAGSTPSAIYWLRLETISGITTIPINLIK